MEEGCQCSHGSGGLGWGSPSATAMTRGPVGRTPLSLQGRLQPRPHLCPSPSPAGRDEQQPTTLVLALTATEGMGEGSGGTRAWWQTSQGGPITVLLGPHVLEHPSTTCKSLALQRGQTSRCPWACPAQNCFPGDQRDGPRFSGTWEDLSPPPQVSGEGLQPISSVLPGCHGLPFSMKQLKPPSLVTGKQRGKQWDPALSLSSIQPGTFPRAPPR